jgi:ubiquinone/menaquinone biosynthesis C-methylase UbiE
MSKLANSSSFLPEEYDDAAGLNTRLAIHDRHGTHITPWFQWVFDHLFFPPLLRLLDLGCGAGHLWWQNRHRLPPSGHLVLSDLSPPMVQAARRHLKSESLAFTFQIADGAALPFPANRFDMVVALGVLDHLPQPARALEEVRRVLKPAGTLYTSAGGQSHLQELEALLRPFLPAEEYGGDPERFGLENGIAQLAPSFEEIRLHHYEDTLVFTTAEPVVAYVRSEGNVAEKLAGVKLAGFVGALQAHLSAHGEIRVTREKGLFVARA